MDRSNKSPTKTLSLTKPFRFIIPKRSSKVTTPMDDLTTIIKDQEATINDLNLRLSWMEQKVKDIEGALVGEDAIDHSANVLEKQIWHRPDGNHEMFRKNLECVNALRKQKYMYRVLGVNPPSNGL
ncbi:hypothetical protein SBOR_0123 [Sclerotinia borealis F-4128]|uniref:Uncharacterized protein n=1 Tax=Sclerotinia borealis (strain F-4128) TaxID=1432307 RepID=W9CTT8_SCLBF|nr:hypothetical protein SBOR_0123 [Sclerotinia borealis F-4128]